MENNIYFLHEHLWTARSWNEPEMKNLLSIPGVITVKGDMCQFDMIQEDGSGVAKIEKTTGFATNAPRLADKLSRTCTGGHRHIQLIGGRSPIDMIGSLLSCLALNLFLNFAAIAAQRIASDISPLLNLTAINFLTIYF